MMRALIDTDVILDLALERLPFVNDAEMLIKAHEQGRFTAYVSAITPINVFYIVRKARGATMGRQAVRRLVNELRVCPVDQVVLQAANALPMQDYEDAVQAASAVASGLDALITRNLGDYAGAPLPVFSPADFLQQLTTP